jgi:hypothetical protein
MLAWGEADLNERGNKGFVPVFWASTEAVESLPKQPVLAWFADWTARWRADDNNFVVRESKLCKFNPKARELCLSLWAMVIYS